MGILKKNHTERLILEVTEESAKRVDLARAVREGLSSHPKSLPPWLFYDDRGSQLFEKITQLPEYYQTRTERKILQKHSAGIAEMFTGVVDLVELGSGSSSKTRYLIEALISLHGNLRYIPVDISRRMLIESSLALLREYHKLEIHAFNCEYYRDLWQMSGHQKREKLILWLGSSVGNLEPDEAVRFLRQVSAGINSSDRFLLGVDMRKDRSIIHRAYNDAEGVTALFNRNLLVRINRELGADFCLCDFEHEAVYDEEHGAVRMFLVSRKVQKVSIRDLGLELHFEKGERIHTENSYKYSPGEIEALARSGGFVVERQWSDERDWFTLSMLAPLAPSVRRKSPGSESE
ncbi:MAG: L-histidine N(alpha)-methyltransferase [Candidatus Glassbacteria bacterium]